MANFDYRKERGELEETQFDLCPPSCGDEEGADEVIRARGEDRERREREREGISGMAGDPQCARVLRPFRQAPAQQGGRDNHAAPDSTRRDGGMERDEETQRGGLGRDKERGGERWRTRQGEEEMGPR